jgi:hypothetical protein
MTQTQLPGTEREIDPDVNAAIEDLRIAEANHRATKQARDKARDRVQVFLVGINPERRAAIERAIALGPPVYHYTDDHGDEVEAVAELELKVKVRKTGAAETPIGEGVDAGDDQEDDEKPRKPRTNGVHPGLLAAAERDGNAVENEDGDIVPSDKPAKRTKAKAKKGRRK